MFTFAQSNSKNVENAEQDPGHIGFAILHGKLVFIKYISSESIVHGTARKLDNKLYSPYACISHLHGLCDFAISFGDEASVNYIHGRLTSVSDVVKK